MRLPPPSTALCVSHTSPPPPPVQTNTTPLHNLRCHRIRQIDLNRRGVPRRVSINQTYCSLEEFVVNLILTLVCRLVSRLEVSPNCPTVRARFQIDVALSFREINFQENQLPRKSTPGEVRSTYMHPLYQLPKLSV